MPGVGSAPSNHLNLRARGAVEVGSLIGGIYLELLNAVERRGHDAGRAAANLVRDDAPRRVTGEAWGVHLHAAVHVVGVLTTVEHERALVHHRTGHASIGGDPW